MPTEVLCALISGTITLIVSIGTWHITAKKDSNANKSFILKNISELKDDISGVNATVQQQLAVVDIKIQTLSDRVEKHNQVVERMYKIEQKVEDLEKIS